MTVRITIEYNGGVRPPIVVLVSRVPHVGEQLYDEEERTYTVYQVLQRIDPLAHLSAAIVRVYKDR